MPDRGDSDIEAPAVRVIAIALAQVPVATVPSRLSAPVCWLIRYSQMVAVGGFDGEAECEPLSLSAQPGQLDTYTYLPLGLMAIASALRPVATMDGDFGISFPVVGLMLYCEMALRSTT